MKVAVRFFSPRINYIQLNFTNYSSTYICMSPLILCLLVLCLNTGNARPLQGLEPDNIGFKKDSDRLINDKQMTAIDKGQGKLSSSVGTGRQEKNAKSLGSWLNAAGNKGNNFALSSAKTILETAEVTQEYYKRKQTRMLESTMDKAKESVDPKEDDDMGEDIVVMDYAQPHRKPPIHNLHAP